ncbi:hypothetical protein CLOM_g6665 [Closterium sp. NIES-68]|nr:hypothetical protein CLOM_g6665 [Closterium sp. NIES-68]GJP63965.1 hypothetical protein CLOP_g20988 [Closterium sp. NIES-67]GJP65360.1 hypothetical protein CLOP_g22252 [Closterium sp. NIES-67]
MTTSELRLDSSKMRSRLIHAVFLLCTAALLAAALPPTTASARDFERYAMRTSRIGGNSRVKWRRLQVVQCPQNQTTCGSLCVDQSTDINNCGACGSFCDVSLACCGGSCANLDSSNDHCGACGARCPGQCTLGICNYGAAAGGGGGRR